MAVEPQESRRDERRPVTPRWVKVFVAIAVVLVVLIVAMLLIGGNHGPGRHLGASGPAVHALAMGD